MSDWEECVYCCLSGTFSTTVMPRHVSRSRDFEGMIHDIHDLGHGAL